MGRWNILTLFKKELKNIKKIYNVASSILLYPLCHDLQTKYTRILPGIHPMNPELFHMPEKYVKKQEKYSHHLGLLQVPELSL